MPIQLLRRIREATRLIRIVNTPGTPGINTPGHARMSAGQA